MTYDGLFTPRVTGGKRLRLNLSPEDMAKTDRGREWSAIVTDTLTGDVYAVQGADCGAPGCFCDATARLLRRS
jgi:hypothetical protein